jgi:hypothetical protein
VYVCVGAKFGWTKKNHEGELHQSGVRKKESPCYLQCLPFSKGREELHVKVTRERVHGLREYREELLTISWAPLSSGVASTVNLSSKLGALGSSLAAKTWGSVGRTEQHPLVRGRVLVGRSS